tara:strand:+ start:1134 stop:3539 length:2406 start_codon:yes stop_codon:yes gene_type:complete
MKNKLKLYFFWILISLLNYQVSFSEEFDFKATEITISENGNILKAIDGVNAKTTDGIVINADQFKYDKKKSILTVKGNVIFKDNLNNISINAKKIIYSRNIEKVQIVDESLTNYNKQYLIKSKNTIFFRDKKEIRSKEITEVKDNFGNLLTLSEFIFSSLKQKITGTNANYLDNQNHNYHFEKVLVDLTNNKIAGKDLVVNFNNSIFNNIENDPRLKGNSAIYEDDKTIVTKGVFTTCKKTDGCPPWLLTADNITHDKKKKIIYYKEAWLKIYDVPVLYFPKFFHPDPTVERQSGFLTPSFSDSNNIGSSLNIPYYHVISNSADLTITPRIFTNEKFLIQNEFRKESENSSHIADFSFIKDGNLHQINKNSSKTHFFLKSLIELKSSFFENSKLEINLEQASNDTYLKTYKLDSPLINDTSTLNSYFEYQGSNPDLQVKTSIQSYEDLTKNNHDRYEFVYPYLDLTKKITNSYDNLGNLFFNFQGYQKKNNTNQYYSSAINNLNFNSVPTFTKNGFQNKYDLLLKNVMEDQKNSPLNDKKKNKLFSTLLYTTSYPLIKSSEYYNNFFTPKISFMYSPNNNKDLRNEDRRVDINNIYSINRIGNNDTVEGGESLTLGAEYKKISKLDELELFSLGIAKIYRAEKNENLPINSTIGEKSSDIMGNMKFKPNSFFEVDYSFSFDNNFKKSNYDSIKSNFTINNFVTSFEYLEDKTTNGESFIENKSTLMLTDNNSLSFAKRKNRKLDVTEFYNLIYEYKNDCLVAGIEYNKEYYTDSDLKPEEKIFFSITITPFGKASGPNINK